MRNSNPFLIIQDYRSKSKTVRSNEMKNSMKQILKQKQEINKLIRSKKNQIAQRANKHRIEKYMRNQEINVQKERKNIPKLAKLERNGQKSKKYTQKDEENVQIPERKIVNKERQKISRQQILENITKINDRFMDENYSLRRRMKLKEEENVVYQIMDEKQQMREQIKMIQHNPFRNQKKKKMEIRSRYQNEINEDEGQYFTGIIQSWGHLMLPILDRLRCQNNGQDAKLKQQPLFYDEESQKQVNQVQFELPQTDKHNQSSNKSLLNANQEKGNSLNYSLFNLYSNSQEIQFQETQIKFQFVQQSSVINQQQFFIL